ncbi:MAG: hypothetical protein HKN66_05440, partial [Flavobacteriaceae bacterium]|nr:hypothetical protein [Flavobacteriaceae bacterium]
GLDRKIFIAHYVTSDPLISISNSLLNSEFINWCESNKRDLHLIEGIGDSLKVRLNRHNINSTNDLAHTKWKDLSIILSDRKLQAISHYPETWITQAMYINSSDWLEAIKLQRKLSSNRSKDSDVSKIEKLAKKEIKDDIFLIRGVK